MSAALGVGLSAECIWPMPARKHGTTVAAIDVPEDEVAISVGLTARDFARAAIRGSTELAHIGVETAGRMTDLAVSQAAATLVAPFRAGYAVLNDSELSVRGRVLKAALVFSLTPVAVASEALDQGVRICVDASGDALQSVLFTGLRMGAVLAEPVEAPPASGLIDIRSLVEV